ncbi:hypothetical protein AS159_02595 [Thermotoga sp. Ku-13t]|uniref:glycosyltransferase family 4 protein n=1 Tax=Thermotoga sp. Ku-13t TaxID=1755813 RepID=UPI0013EB5088|nr:glycosyltransferase family 4 protein [Thermotoga sp. Ku-13t]KAF2958594.1 hypothetical protein AS159_02595 [Thermotoga sp. Ku-13t]
MRKIHVWLVDKYFLPPPIPTKNRYKILLDMEHVTLLVFSSRFSEYDKTKKVETKVLQKNYKNASWVFIPTIGISRATLYISFAFLLFVIALTLLLKNKLKKPDLIIASCPDPFQSFAAFLVSKIIKVPFVVDFRDYWPELLEDKGVIKRDSISYKSLFLLTRILAKFSNGIMAAEDTYLKQYLLTRRVSIDKPIFVRDNLFLDDLDDDGETDILLPEKEEIEKILGGIERLRANKRFVLLLVGRQNIKDENIERIQKALEIINQKAGLIALSNDEKLKKLRISCKDLFIEIYDMLSRQNYVRIINNVDAMLLFVTDKRTKFSSNKAFDAICNGKPVLIGLEKAKRKSESLVEIPGVILFDLDSPEEISSSLERLSELVNDLQVKERLKSFCRSTFVYQKKTFFEFLKTVSCNADKVK